VRLLVAKAPKMFHSTDKATACFKVTAMFLVESCFIKLRETRKIGHMKRNTTHSVTPCSRRENPIRPPFSSATPHEKQNHAVVSSSVESVPSNTFTSCTEIFGHLYKPKKWNPVVILSQRTVPFLQLLVQTQGGSDSRIQPVNMKLT
jgi:hypothetical protein